MPENLTIKGILGRKAQRDRVYVVKAGKAVVYVGKAYRQSVSTRIGIHIQVSTWDSPKSKFAQLLSDSHPDYFDWRVQVLSQRECERLTGRKVDSLSDAERAIYDHFLERQREIVGNTRRP